jgi:prepilin peptidase CpaA
MSFLSIAGILVFVSAQIYAGCRDFVTYTIPNRISLALLAAFPVFALASGIEPAQIGVHLAVGGIVLVAAFGLFALGWLGGGDAKLVAATALWFGGDVLIYLFAAALAGGALSLAVLSVRNMPLPALVAHPWLERVMDPKAGIPYGVALAAGAVYTLPHSGLWRFAGLG